MAKNEIIIDSLSYPSVGDIPIRMNSDLLFHYLLQDSNNSILKGIISAFFDIPVEDIISATVENPISYGDNVDSKEMILDVKTLLNNNQFINLEMQLINYHDWPERALSYLCRAFDNLKIGEQYNHVRGAYHIGFLDFTLFPEMPNFFTQYALREEKTHHLFTSKFKISVVDLSSINTADDSDKSAHRDLWARFFKATRWEELHMLAAQDKYIDEVTLKLHSLIENQKFRDQLWAREDYIRREKDRDDHYNSEIMQRYEQIVILKKSNSEMYSIIADKDAEIAALKAKLAEKNL